jgi:hypothetical protein
MTIRNRCSAPPRGLRGTTADDPAYLPPNRPPLPERERSRVQIPQEPEVLGREGLIVTAYLAFRFPPGLGRTITFASNRNIWRLSEIGPASTVWKQGTTRHPLLVHPRGLKSLLRCLVQTFAGRFRRSPFARRVGSACPRRGIRRDSRLCRSDGPAFFPL